MSAAGDLVPVLDDDAIAALVDEYLPVAEQVGNLQLRGTRDGRVHFVADGERLMVRPGGTISGPALFATMDLAAFFTVNAYVGPTPSATLHHADLDFLEAAEPGLLAISVELVKLGWRFALTSARVHDDSGLLVASSSLQFALPTRATRRRGQLASPEGATT